MTTYGAPSRSARRTTARTTLRVNPIRCEGHGMCAELLPELVGLDEWGYPVLGRSGADGRDESSGGSSTDVPHDLEDHARRAVDACPALALVLRREARRQRR